MSLPQPLYASAPIGVVAAPFATPTVQRGTFAVGGSTIGSAGATAKGHRYSEVPVVHAYATKRWAESKFEQKQRERQLMFGVRSSGKHPEVVAMLTDYQLNSVLRRVHETSRRLALYRDARLGGPNIIDDREQLKELVAQLREGGELFLLGDGVGDNRFNEATLARTLKYYSAEGIFSIFNYLGPYQNDSGRDDGRTWFTLNLVHQGPAVVNNSFQALVGEDTPGFEPDLAPPIEVADYLHMTLRRRYSSVTQQYEEFVIEHSASQNRYVEMEKRIYEAYDGTDAYGPTWRVGRVLDVLGERPDPRTLLRMRGIVNSWEDAYEAHGENQSFLKISVGADRHDVQCG